MKNRAHLRMSPLIASLSAAAVIGALFIPAAAATSTPTVATALPPGQVRVVDPDVTPATASLFNYLQDVRGVATLFGHQHTTSFGVTIGTADGTTSDVKNGVGDFPAIFGWDTLILQGDERPGQAANTTDQNIAAFADYIQKADTIGGISTISAHMENFVTGGSFYDTTGDTLRAVLPGGAKHDALKAYLDNIATLAGSIHDADGNLIPIIFRPWHENAGSWFWWGAAYGSPGEYAELYRFTVEYLRDVKGVHNFLYAFSPGGGFGGNADTYLRTYPGDAYIDILGYDSYDNGQAGAAWLNGMVTDLGMIADLADARDKVSAFTEFGVSTSGLLPNGQNANLNWFTDVLNAIKADPRASRSAYMETWANFGSDQFFIPYPAYADQPAHELLPDFQAYADDPFSYFASDLTGVFDRTVTTVANDPLVHLVSPADGSRVAATPTTVRARVVGTTADRVFLTVGADPTEIELSLDADGFWSGVWPVPAESLNNSTVAVRVHVFEGGVETLTDDASVVLGPKPTFAPGVVDDFEGYGDDNALRAEYVQYNTNTLTLETGSVGQGSKAMRVSYDFAAQEYTGVGKQIAGDWSGFGELSLWIDPDASNNKLVLQLQAGGVSYEAYPSLAGDDPYEISIPWADWRPASWDTANADRRITFEDLQAPSQFNIYLNSVPEQTAVAGSVVVDNIRATGTPPPPVFSDVTREHRSYKEIMWLYDQGLDNGYRDGKFHPNWLETRQDAASLLYRYVGAEFTADNTPTYRDVRTRHPFYTEIEWLVAQGLVDVPTGHHPEFKPNAPLDRATAASLLYRLAGSPQVAITDQFRDVPTETPAVGVRHGWHKWLWHKGADVDPAAISWAVEQGVITPVSDDVFGARTWVTREDMAVYLYRYDALPDPFVTLFDFESGTQSWAGAGTVASAGGALAITSTDGWFGVDQGGVDLTGRTTLSFDLDSATDGSSFNYALKLGPDWTWCQGADWVWVDPSTVPTTVNLDLTTMSPECQALASDFKGIQVFFNPGTFVIDDVRVS